MQDYNDEVDEHFINTEQRWYNAALALTRSRPRRILLFIISDVFFFAIVIKLCGFLSCNYELGQDPRMAQVPEVVCLQGQMGKVYGITAMLGLLYYVFTSFCYTNMQCEVSLLLLS
jgi:heme/copper-type cytochrome/quinol oxidase subunit 3